MNAYSVELTNGPTRPVEADHFDWEKDEIVFRDDNEEVVAWFNPTCVVSILLLPKQDK